METSEAIGTKLVQFAPWHLSTEYSVTPRLSVDAVQVKLICKKLTTVAASADGAVGGIVSIMVVVAVATLE